jgi:LPS-assembly protein
LLAAMLVLAPVLPAHTQTTPSADQPSVFRADELTYDRELGLVTATGNVEIAQGDRVLLADTVSYEQRTGNVTASGNVALLEPSGDIVFADYVELTDELRSGVIRDIRILLADRSRFAANGATRSGGRITTLDKAVYSPCELCAEDPMRAPLWQIKAVRVVHDQGRHDIKYYDAWLEVFGVPIAYTPYFQHPDPTVKRRTGLLAPSFGDSSNLGTFITLPFYVALAPYRDFTFTPKLTTKEGAVFFGEFRERTRGGAFTLEGSITRTDERDDRGVKTGGMETRGHVKGDGLFQIDETLRWGFDVYRSTDDTYLSRYNIDSADTLTSTVFGEAFRARSYAAAETFFFQGLDEDDDPGTIPFITPLMNVNLVSEPREDGSYATVDLNGLMLTRDDGTDSRRLSLEAAWHVPRTGPAGDLYELRASLRGDAYDVDDVAITGSPGGTRDGFTGRVLPELSLAWRWPWVRHGGRTNQLIEPIAVAAVSPYGVNPSKIPNEDSTDVELTDINLFETQRFPGLDRVESGPRIAYGLRFGTYGAGGGHTTFLFGQSYRARRDDTFKVGSGLESDFSDFVGRVDVAPTETFDIAYRFRLDKDGFKFRRNEVEATLGPERLRLSVSYLALSDKVTDVEDPDEREEIAGVARAEFSRYWAIDGNIRSDLTGFGLISAGGGITYEDECVILGLRVQRRFTSDRDSPPDTSVIFVVKLLHLG